MKTNETNNKGIYTETGRKIYLNRAKSSNIYQRSKDNKYKLNNSPQTVTMG